MELVSPISATLFMTDACNLRCSGCKRQVDGFSPAEEVTLATVQHLLSLYPSISSVCIAGLGEPTLCSHFPAIINFLKQQRKYVGVITNGTHVDPIFQAKESPDYISVSLYGYDRESYFKNVKRDVFDTVIYNFSLLKGRLPCVGISSFVNKKNYLDLPKIIDLAESIGSDFINVTNYLPYSQSSNEIELVISAKDSTIIEQVDNFLAKSKRIGARPVYVDATRTEFNCPSYAGLINIDGTGNVSFCQRQVPPSAEYGNIFTDHDCFVQGPVSELRAKIKRGLYPHENCTHCFGRFFPASAKIDLAVAVLFHEKPEQTLECIRSFLRLGVAVYVLDNHSSAESRSRLEAGISDYTNVTLFRASENLGVAKGRNWLIENTTEEWLFFVDNDIALDDGNVFEILQQQISLEPFVDVFIPELYNVHEDSHVNVLEMFLDHDHIRFRKCESEITNYFPGGASIVNRKVFLRHGLYDREMFIGLEDMEFALRAVVSDSPLKCKSLKSIKLRHDHRVVLNPADKAAIVTRYDMSIQRRSYLRMLEKYPGLKFEHHYQSWIVEQQTRMLDNRYLDLGCLTTLANFGAKTRRRFRIDHLPPSSGEVLAREVLDIISRLFCGTEKVLFVGYGSARQTIEAHMPAAFFSDPDWDYRAEEALVFNPDDYNGMRTWADRVQEMGVEVFVVAPLLERLQDPRPFLNALRERLFLGGRCILTVDPLPEVAIGQARGSYWRQWDVEGFKRFLCSSGFSVNLVQSPIGARSYFEIRATAEDYEIFLRSLYLPPSTIEYVVVSQEHSLAPKTGGIGTYVGELERILAPSTIALFLTGIGDLLPDRYECREKRYIHLQQFLTPQSVPLEDAVTEILEVIVYLYHQLKVIEFQDVNGKGYRFLQGLEAGLYPSRLMTQTLCHASRISLEKIYSIWIEPLDTELLEEKLVIEKADAVKFPTSYLHGFYKQVGYQIDDARSRIERLPFASHCEVELPDPYPVMDTLIFFGKRSRYKGFDLFSEVIRTLVRLGCEVKRVLLIGPRFEDTAHYDTFYEEISKQGVLVEESSLGREEAMRLLSENACRSLCILPYVADNHPYALLEIINSGCPLIATQTGGMPELIPASHALEVLVPPDAASIADRVVRWFQAPPAHRREFADGLRQAAWKEQERINRQLYPSLQHVYSQWEHSRPRMPDEFGSITCLVLVDRQRDDLIDVKTVLETILLQTDQPLSVIILVSPSSPQADAMTRIVASMEDERFRVHLTANTSHGAMLNEGLGLVESDLVIPLCPGISLANGCFRAYRRFLRRNPAYDAVTSYLGIAISDDEGEAPALERFLGEGVLVGQLRNTLGHHFSMYRAAALRACDGFAPSEDLGRNGWLTLLGLVSRGRKVGVVPRALIQASPSGLPVFGALYADQHALATQTVGLSRFDSFRLQGLAQAWRRTEEDRVTARSLTKPEIEALESGCRDELERLLNSRSWKITKPLRELATNWRKVFYRA